MKLVILFLFFYVNSTFEKGKREENLNKKYSFYMMKILWAYFDSLKIASDSHFEIHYLTFLENDYLEFGIYS